MIRANHVVYAYRGMDSILQDVCFEEETGHCVALLGNNGAGKSTFLKCLNRILEPKEGRIVIDTTELMKMTRVEIARNMAYVEQHTDVSKLTVYDTVLLGRKPHIRFEPSSMDYEIVDEAIARFELEDMSLRNIDELSGGELQKVVLARAIAQKPNILLLDEPTASLDLRNQHEVMRIVSEIASEDDITVVVVIHDLNLALQYCDRFMLIHEGRAYRYGDSSVITEETIQTVYGVSARIMMVDGSKVVLVKR